MSFSSRSRFRSSFVTFFGETGGFPHGISEAGVSPSGPSSLCHYNPFSRFDKVGDDLTSVLIVDNSTAGDGDHEIVSPKTRLELSLPGASVACLELSLVFEVSKSQSTGKGFKKNVSSPTAVAAVRTALGNKFFPAETEASVSALAGPDLN